jgi:hypothetical protein
MARQARRGGLALALAAALAAALPQAPYEVTVHAGTSLRGVARHLVADGVLPEAESLWIVGRALGKDRSIQAGVYRLDAPLTPFELLQKLAHGDVVILELKFVEGTTFRQWQAQLAAAARVRHTLAGKSEAQLREAFAVAEPSLEGWFFPDTYRFPPGSADVDILKRAHGVMVKRLADTWASRSPQTLLRTPYEALVLASIVEKETALAEERPLVDGDLRNGRKLRREHPQEGPDGGHAMEHLHARRIAADADRDAGRGLAARGGASGRNAFPLFRVARRRIARVLAHARGAQPRRGEVPAEGEPRLMAP